MPGCGASTSIMLHDRGFSGTPYPHVIALCHTERVPCVSLSKGRSARMRHRLVRIWAAALLSAAFSLGALSGAHARSVKPRLAVGKAQGYSFTLKGTGWSGHQTVVVAVTIGDISAGVEVRTTARGTFAVGVTGMARCAGVGYSAVDLRSRRVHGSLGTAARACLAYRPAAPPVVRVLHGSVSTRQRLRCRDTRRHPSVFTSGMNSSLMRPVVEWASHQPPIQRIWSSSRRLWTACRIATRRLPVGSGRTWL